jgi:hypothetical protein
MAEKEENSPSIPWLPLITLIGVGSGVLLFFPQLLSSRPGGGDPQLAGNTFDEQTVDARLWQDPLGVASADREKTEKDETEKKQKSEAHSVTCFQKLLIQKCFAESAINPLNKEFRFAAQASQLEVFAVMIPGGPYVEDVERRLRARRAVIEALGRAGYDPEKDDEIGYSAIPWQPLAPDAGMGVSALEKKRTEDQAEWLPTLPGIQPARHDWKGPDQKRDLLIPYEWCEQASFSPERKPVAHLLVLWITDDAFFDAPLARLSDLISWFRLKFNSTYGVGELLPLPLFNVLGPDNSGTLHKMVIEAKEDRWNDETRRCLSTKHIYSSQAAAAESRLLFGIGTAGEPPSCKHLIEQRLQSGTGFRFERTIFPDDQIVETLRQELERRGVKNNDDVAIVSEEDTYYSRALCSTFDPASLPNIHSYTYLRGIDGKLPAEREKEKETKGVAELGGNNARSSTQPMERTEDLNQADDIRRLAKMLQNLDTYLRDHGSQGLKAVGLLGSDVYDKLELLKALRPMLPEAVFFTNNLDAGLAHPDEWTETHNLLVVSARGLSLIDPDQTIQRVAPFRDSGQTALFEATLEAIGQIHAGDPRIPKSPLIFEISRNGPKELSMAADPSIPTAEFFDSLKNYLPRIGGFIAFGSLLLAWIYLVSRVSWNSSNAEIRERYINLQRLFPKLFLNREPDEREQV